MSRLRIRQHGATGVGMFLKRVHLKIVSSDALLPKDSSILNFSRPIKVYASQATAPVDETKRQPTIAHASTVKTTTHGPIATGRTYPAKAIMQWNYTVREEYACMHPDAHLHRSPGGHTHTFKNLTWNIVLHMQYSARPCVSHCLISTTQLRLATGLLTRTANQILCHSLLPLSCMRLDRRTRIGSSFWSELCERGTNFRHRETTSSQ